MMNNEIKENLIEIVRKHECLYNTKNKEYKNMSYKSLLWEKIGATLQIQGSKAKDTWRSLRDGYIRHKKAMRGQTGASRKYSNYTWSSQMSFLDGTLELRPTSTNITPPQPDSEPSQPPSPVPRQSSPIPRQPSPVIHVLETRDFPSSTQSQQPPTTSSQPLPSPASRTMKKKDSRSVVVDNSERVLEYLKNKKKKEWDGVDHLFMSYAKSFKLLSVRNKAKIKVELAKLFAAAELDEFENEPEKQESVSVMYLSPEYDNNSTSEPQNQASSLMYLAPAYSVLSDNSEEVILVTDEHEQEPMQPELVAESTSHEPTQEILLDLTNYNSNNSQN